MLHTNDICADRYRNVACQYLSSGSHQHAVIGQHLQRATRPCICTLLEANRLVEVRPYDGLRSTPDWMTHPTRSIIFSSCSRIVQLLSGDILRSIPLQTVNRKRHTNGSILCLKFSCTAESLLQVKSSTNQFQLFLNGRGTLTHMRKYYGVFARKSLANEKIMTTGETWS